MNTGLVAVLVGILAALGAWLLGKSSGKRETIKEVKTQETIHKALAEKAIAKDTARIINESAAANSDINEFFSDFATKVGNEIEAGQALADRAKEWQGRNQ